MNSDTAGSEYAATPLRVGRVGEELYVYRALRDFVKDAGSQKLAANVLGISQQYLCDLLKGRRDFSDLVCERLGFERIVLYRRLR